MANVLDLKWDTEITDNTNLMFWSLQNYVPFSVPDSKLGGNVNWLKHPSKWPQPCTECFSLQGDQSTWQVLWDPVCVKEHIHSICYRICTHLPRKRDTQSQASARVAEESLAKKGNTLKGHLAMALFPTTTVMNCWWLQAPSDKRQGKLPLAIKLFTH